MCELFGMSSHQATVATFTFERFAARGGLAGKTIDGWGLALYDGADVRLYREPEPALDSDWLRYVQRRHLPSRLLLSHIRHATRGAVTLANTQPFVREIAGRMHCFAHNGRLEPLVQDQRPELQCFHPTGDTDSEVAACLLFGRMARLWTPGAIPPLAQRIGVVTAFAAEMRALGPANFLYTDGIMLLAHGHRRTQADGRIAPPGLWRLQRHCAADPDALQHSGLRLESVGGPQDIVLLASVPLTDENWQPFGEGEIVAVEHGMLVGVT
jgi:predicted glutamine amidotransferase